MKDMRKASKSLTPPPLSLYGDLEGISSTVHNRACTEKTKLPEREGIQNPPPLANTSGSNCGRGFHLFGF